MALFAGAGGGLLASRLLGWRTRCAVEIDSYARRVLLARQRDGHLDRFPIWDDVKTFDGRPWRGSVDVVSGGWPCVDIAAPGRRRGISGERSGLVFEMLRIVGEVRPRFVFAENSPRLRTNGLGTVLQRLDRMGYQSRWCVLGARHVGACHRRDRIWVLSTDADRAEIRDERRRRGGTDGEGPRELGHDGATRGREALPCIYGSDDDLAYRMDRLRAVGNGQVPRVAALAWNILRGLI